MRKISLQNITADVRSVIPSIVAGLEDSPIREVRLSNIRIAAPIAVLAETLERFPADPPENTKGYPENRLTFGFRLPAAALYVRHVEGIDVTDLTVTRPESEARPAFFFDDVRGIRLRDARVNGRLLEAGASGLRLKGSSGLEVLK